jgi:hypothetical protein
MFQKKEKKSFLLPRAATAAARTTATGARCRKRNGIKHSIVPNSLHLHYHMTTTIVNVGKSLIKFSISDSKLAF